MVGYNEIVFNIITLSIYIYILDLLEMKKHHETKYYLI